MSRTRPEPLKGGPGTRQLPEENHPKGCAEHARSPSRGILALANFLRKTIMRDVQNTPGVPQGEPWHSPTLLLSTQARCLTLADDDETALT
ncbi:unnamed protein product [Prunus armeniaca]